VQLSGDEERREKKAQNSMKKKETNLLREEEPGCAICSRREGFLLSEKQSAWGERKGRGGLSRSQQEPQREGGGKRDRPDGVFGHLEEDDRQKKRTTLTLIR